MRVLVRLLLVAGLFGLLAAAFMYAVALRDPLVRTAVIPMVDWPKGAPPFRVALLTDLHLAGPDMPPSRIARIVAQVNQLKPDLVLFAGDFVSDKAVSTHRYDARQGLAPLAGIKATHGAWAVLGNHDHWRSAEEVSTGLTRAGIRILDNKAVSVGPVRLGGVDDDYTGQADIPQTIKAMRSGSGSRILLSHSPDITPRLPPDVGLVLAGHTHCGQIRLPVVGAVSYESQFGDRYDCGLKQESGRHIVISAGLGTSVLPFRLGAVPDLWLLTLRSSEPR